MQSSILNCDDYKIKNISQLQKTSKMLYDLQHQVLSQDITLHIKINKHIWLIHIQICLNP